jgi:molybdate transport system substrate-binding protein
MALIKVVLSVCAVSSVVFSQSAYAETLKIYAAASLSNAITDIAQQYEQQHPDIKVTAVFAASSTLAKQIEAGAPADIFFSADEKWMNYLVAKNQIDSIQVKPLLNNQLVLISPKNQKFSYQPTADLSKAFKGKLCTGQTESVPVGMYAKQSLIALNQYDALKRRIVGVDDVRAALAFVERGECAAGIVYATDAKISKKVEVVAVLPKDSHQAIIYPVAVTKQASPVAKNLLNYIQSHPKARATFVRYGFSVMH